MNIYQAKNQMEYQSYNITTEAGEELIVIEKKDAMAILESLVKESDSLPCVSDQRELLISFMEFRDKIYWGENEFTENEDIIDLWLKRNQ